jgi:hypothetical protein
VRVTAHATRRFRERVKQLPETTVEKRAWVEIHQGLAEGRYSKHEPSWTAHHRRATARREGRRRFVWPTHRQYAYVIRLFGDSIVVLTVLEGYLQQRPTRPAA